MVELELFSVNQSPDDVFVASSNIVRMLLDVKRSRPQVLSAFGSRAKTQRYNSLTRSSSGRARQPPALLFEHHREQSCPESRDRSADADSGPDSHPYCAHTRRPYHPSADRIPAGICRTEESANCIAFVPAGMPPKFSDVSVTT